MAEFDDATRLDRFWDSVARGGAEPPAPIDPADAETIRRFQVLGAAPAPEDAFLARLWGDLAGTRGATTFDLNRNGVVPYTGASRAELTDREEPTEAPRPLRFRRIRRVWPVLEVAAMLVFGVGATLMLLTATGALPSLRALWGGEDEPAAMTTYRGGPGRTGEQPGPGPRMQPVKRWRITPERPTASPAAPVVVDGVAFAILPPGVLVAAEIASGAVQWRFPASGDAALAGTPAVVAGVAFAGDRAGTLHAIDAATGTEVWSHAVGAEFSSPTVVDGLVFLAEGASDGGDPAVDGGLVFFNRSCACTRLVALDAATGAERWSVVGETEGLYAVDAGGGARRWSAQPDPALGELAVADGTLFGTDDAGNVVAFDAETGEEQWRHAVTDAAGRPVRQVTAPAVADGLVYVVARAGSLHALHAETGEEAWQQPLGASAITPPTVAGGTVYAGTLDGDLLTFAAESGEPRWSTELGGWLSRPPAVVGDAFYAIGDDGSLIALGEPPPEARIPAPSS